MHSQFLFQIKLSLGKLSYFPDMNLHKFLLLHQIAILLCLTPGDTHEQVDKKIALPKVTVWFQRCEHSWLKWKQTQYQLHNSFIQTLLIRLSHKEHFLIFKLRQGCHLFAIVEILHSLGHVSNLLDSHPHISQKLGREEVFYFLISVDIRQCTWFVYNAPVPRFQNLGATSYLDDDEYHLFNNILLFAKGQLALIAS